MTRALLRELAWVRRQLHALQGEPLHRLCRLGYSDLIGEEVLILGEMRKEGQ